MTDQELNILVSGNGTTFILPYKANGTYTVIQCKVTGDIDKMKQSLHGGSINNIEFIGGYSKMTISENKLDDYIGIL